MVPAEVPIEVGLQARPAKAAVWSMVTVPEVRETGIEVPLGAAAVPPVSCTIEDGSVVLLDKVRVTVASTAFGRVVLFNPQAMHVELPEAVVQDNDFPEAPGPAATTADEKSVVE